MGQLLEAGPWCGRGLNCVKKTRSNGQVVHWLQQKRRFLHQAFEQHGWRGVVNNLQNDWDARRLPERVVARPLRLVLEPTVRCNLNCTFCDTNEVFRTRDKKYLTAADFERILDQLPFVQSLNPTLRGEALVSPHIFEILTIAKRRDIRIRLVTNGLLLAKPDKRRKLIEIGVDHVVFSVDAVGEEYERIRQGAKFATLNDAVRAFAAESQAADGGPRVSVAIVGDEHHAEQPPAVIRWAAELGIREVEIQPIHNWGELNVVVHPLSTANIDHCRIVAEEFDVRLNVYLPSEGRPGARRCTFPWDTVVVASDGRVTPCCVFGTDPDRLNFGNVLEQPFDAIWNGDGMQQFRRDLKNDDDVPEFCRGCPHY